MKKTLVLTVTAMASLGIGFVAGSIGTNTGYVYHQFKDIDDVSRVNLKTGVKEYASDYGWVTIEKLGDLQAASANVARR